MADISGIWPRERPRPGDSQAEVKVWEALKNSLPQGWTAWHSLRLRTGDGWEGEGDFVVAAPGRGFVILEVKGGNIEQHDGIWRQNGHPMQRPPRSQAFGFAKLVARRLAEQNCHAPYGIATVFPDTAWDQGPTQDDLRDTVFGMHDLPHICEVLNRNLGAIIPQSAEPPHGQWEEAMHRMWGETWIPQASLGTRHQVNEERRIRLDHDQISMLDQNEKTRLALIYGMAGSGKTMLAREKALHARAEGKRVTVLCFTDALASNLRASLAGAGILVDTVRSYAVDLLLVAGKIRGPGEGAEFWDSVSHRAATEALPPAVDRPDLVIVDEAQDFSTSDWELVKALADDPDGDPVCWAFCDMTQRYWPDRELPGWLQKGWIHDLESVYRCPPPIMALARAVVGKIPAGDGSLPLPEGVDATDHGATVSPDDLALIRQGITDGVIKIIEAHSPKTISTAVEAEVARLLKAGLQADDIAVISLAGQTATDSIARTKIFAGNAVLAADHPNANNRLVADTFLRFKGLERPAIIVTDLHLRSDERLPTRLFIAMTRAQDFLRIVVAPGDLDKVPVLRQICTSK